MNMLLNPFWYGVQGGGGGGDPSATVDVVSFANPGVTGNLDVTSPDLTGITPKGAIIFMSGHDPANDPAGTPHAQFAVGMVDSLGNVAWTRAMSQDNVATGNTSRSADDSGFFSLFQGAAETVAVAISSATLISGGVRLNFSTANPSYPFKGFVFLLADDEMDCRVADFAVASGTNTITPGVQPDLLIGIPAQAAVSGSYTTQVHQSLCFATADGSQTHMHFHDRDGDTAAFPYQSIDSNTFWSNSDNGTAAQICTITVSNFTATTFDINRTGSFFENTLLYMAVSLGTKQAKIKQFDAPTSTGGQSLTGVGFEPQAALLVTTGLEALDVFNNTTNDTRGFFGVCGIGQEKCSIGYRVDSGSDPTDTESIFTSDAVLVGDGTDIDAGKASFTSFDADGVTFNWSAVPAAAKKCIGLFFS